jgi:uncharacterized membrane protein
VDLYDVIVAVHILGVVVAFGVTFAYPVLLSYARKQHAHTLPALHHAQGELGIKVMTPGMVVVLGTGIYLASDRDLWDRPWVSIPMVILIVLFGLGGAFFAPKERELAALAERDLDGTAGLSAEYEALFRKVRAVGALAALLVVIAVFVMATKPGGYT